MNFTVMVVISAILFNLFLTFGTITLNSVSDRTNKIVQNIVSYYGFAMVIWIILTMFAKIPLF